MEEANCRLFDDFHVLFMNDDLHLPIESFCLNLDGFSGIIPIFFDFLQFLGILKSISLRLIWDKLLPLSWLGYHS